MPGGEVARIEWPIRIGPASIVAAGPAAVSIVGFAPWLWVPPTPKPTGSSSYDSLFRDPTFRVFFLALLGACALMALNFLIASRRHQPALLLDSSGITAWTENRRRHIPWDQVESIGPVGSFMSSTVLYAVRRHGGPIRLHERLFGVSFFDVMPAVITWMNESGPPEVVVRRQ